MGARARMLAGKSAGGGIALVSDILKVLTLALVYVVSQAFEAKYEGTSDEVADDWKFLQLVFLAKEAGASTLLQFRGIALLSCFAK